MLQLAVTFLVIALIAGFFGFAGVAAPFLGRGEDSLRDLPHPCRVVFPGARDEREAFLGVTEDRRSSAALSHYLLTFR